MMPERRPIKVVFVHGLFSSPEVWDRFVRLIDEDPELGGWVTTHCFRYPSRLFRIRPDRRIGDLNDAADLLRTDLSVRLRDAEAIVLVTHSQGGLVAQFMLARSLNRAEGQELARIKQIVMFACPNSGSEFFLAIRRAARFWNHPQERQLRPFNAAVAETQRLVFRAVVRAQAHTDTECPIHIAAYCGASDNIVPRVSAEFMWPDTGTVEGDHFAVIQPDSSNALSYKVLKKALMAVTGQGDSPPTDIAETPTERNAGVSVTPPFGRRGHQLRGRESLMSAISSSDARVHVLAGMGGSGKSRLALELADQARRAGHQVWWVGMTRVSSSMREVANQLGVPEGLVERAWRGAGSAADLVWRALDAQPEPWLLIFDNADEPQRLGPAGGQVSDGTGWLREPANPAGQVIVTSRDRNEATWGTWSAVHVVPPLTDEDGALMLADIAGPAGGSSEQARLLCAELGGLPLALRAAADYVKLVASSTAPASGTAGVTDFASYRAYVKARFEAPPGAPSQDLDERDGREIMRQVSDISLELLGHRGLAQAGPLLRLFACLNIAPIPYQVLLGTGLIADSPLFAEFSEQQRTAVLNALADLGLVEQRVLPNIGDPSISRVLSLHPVVHGILRDDEDVRQRRADYYGLNARMLLAAADGHDPDQPESWVIWDVLAPHTLEVARATLLGPSTVPDRGVITLALELARLTCRYLIVTGLIGPAEDLVQPMVTRCAAFGCQPDDRGILGLRHEQARIALERGDPGEAEAELRRVIVARERILGADHPDTLASQHKLAKAILEQDRWAEAEPLLRSIVARENTVRGPEHSDTMVVRHSLARAILAQHRAAEAEQELRDILAVRNRIWSPATPETLYVRQTLARSLLEQGKTEAADTEIQDTLRIAAARPDAPLAMSLRYTHVEVLLMQNRVPEAIRALEKLHEDRRRVLGPTHPDTLRTSAFLGRVRQVPGPPPG
jgi:pimeloyl-ACP methyl ester carboxylesterase